MLISDIFSILLWWLMLFVISLIFLPLTSKIFSNFIDRGYIFSRIIGIAAISYAVFVLGFLKIFPFTEFTISLAICIFLLINIFIFVKVPALRRLNLLISTWKMFVFEESIFLSILFFWSFIHAHTPDIHGLEKYMDYGFINSILRSEYFPPLDMWLTPLYINYYYFGHLVTAVLTKLSALPSSTTYNLMLSIISAFTFTASFSIGANLLNWLKTKRGVARLEGVPSSARRELATEDIGWDEGATGPRAINFIAGLLTAFLVSLAGNLHAIYTFFNPYVNENPVPLWQLAFSPGTFPNSYWYPNATRFIENTIHEFPIYSSVVSDLHGHVLDIPFVLLIIAVFLSLFFNLKIENLKLKIPLISFLLAVMYMTNAWDGIIYFLLASFVLLVLYAKKGHSLLIVPWFWRIVAIGAGAVLFSLPFSLYFKPFASGIGILCAPEFLTKIGKIGPFLFEADHCQHSPWWQLLILYGFFYFWVFSFIIFILSKLKSKLNPADKFVLILIAISTLLIIIPEFIYVKDIYPAHYRANTMFKLVYQSFIMLSISSGYIIIRLFLNHKSSIINRNIPWKLGYWIIGFIGLFVVFIYPYLAIKSYFGDLRTYHGLDGTKYLKTLYPTDYEAILWINKNVKGQPVILEAQGDSYTDYARVSSNTGLPTVLGWSVHEWLWRGTYDVPSPRIPEVQTLYETENIEDARRLIDKYNIQFVFIGNLEREKYPKLNEQKFKSLGKIIYENGETKIYKLN